MLDLTAPPSRPLVAPSVLACDFGAAAEDAKDVIAKGADLLHLDVMDGHFVPNLTFGVDMIRGLRKHLPDTFLDVHLMVERPQDYVAAFADAGANSFTFHIEISRPHRTHGIGPEALIDDIRKHGMAPGIVLNPPTPAEWVEPLFEQVDMVLVMSVFPGHGGQKFIPDVLEKTAWIKERLSPSTRLEMDGGLNVETTKRAVAAGVDVVVAGSAVFGADDRAAVIEAMHRVGENA